jgi:membrane protease YdiL (CAAX protease family)
MTSNWLGLVWTLLKTARLRTKARQLAALKTHSPKRHSSVNTLTVFAFFAALFFAVGTAIIFTFAAPIAQEVEAENHSDYLASAIEIERLVALENTDSPDLIDTQRREAVFDVLADIANERRFIIRKNYIASIADVEKHFDTYGSAGFVERKALFDSPPACSLLALMLTMWWLALVLQSDGMELDTTRRRHPMWEYFLSLPIAQSAVFTAEALSPVMSNPFYWAAPLVIASVAGIASGSVVIGICALPLGLPLVLAAAVWAKANEVLIMLRLSPRNRGACFVLLSGLGMVFLFAPLLLTQAPKAGFWLLHQLYPALEYLPSARWLVQADTPLHWLRALAVNVALAGGLSLLGITAMRWAAARGLESGFGAPDVIQTTSGFANVSSAHWWRDPLLRKELLWLRRDRSALIQILLVPILLVAAQSFNLTHMLRDFELNWHRAAGLVMFFGGYMLFVAGPRALVSEAPALALTLSWPRLLEDTLRLKVRVLFALISVIVFTALFGLMFVFPADWTKLLIIMLLWPLFGLSVVEKAVTLIRSPSSSGEPEPLPRETVWAAGLGNLAFGTGLFMGNWQAALLGLTLNWVLAGALWQAFRARLPYLFDPQSQPAVRPPTILSSVLAILGMQELGIIFSIPLLFLLDPGGASFAMVLGYGVAGALVCFVVWRYHQKHNVSLRDIIYLSLADQATRQISLADQATRQISLADQATRQISLAGRRHGKMSGARWPALPSFALALGIGVSLGLLAIFYTQFLHSDWVRAWLPSFSAALTKSDQALKASPNILMAYGLFAIAVAPWAEEFLFRGLMFRAMHMQWGYWPALLLSTTFFTLLHPVASWPMVCLLGASSAWLFVRTQALAPCVLLHFIYNGIVVVGH